MEITKRHYLKSGKYESSRVIIKNYHFQTSGDVAYYVTNLDDYTIISNFDITNFIKDDIVIIQNKGLKKQVIGPKTEQSTSPLFPQLKISRKKHDTSTQISQAHLCKATEALKRSGIKCIPKSIHVLLEKHWIHAVHIQTFSRALITRAQLRARVDGGQF
ncbi:unnamed protein product [Macrosiphum euphorbiae]|uniref:Uncharacterized protein n=1 Tax=Macrosiphum euphorbiae TaxID=13131 RepID=A0AAV0Y252_9HEMI|nr:unnamed protein product [Macrosiphum euphorbiae]